MSHSLPNVRHEKRPRVAERLIMDYVRDCPESFADSKVLCWSLGRAQLAAYVASSSNAEVDCLYHDLYLANQARCELGDSPERLTIHCQPDPPPGPFDFALLPLSRRGEAELSMDLLQSFYNSLEIGGSMWVAVDNPKDRWVRHQFARYRVSISSFASQDAIMYRFQKQEELAKHKDYTCTFHFRDRGRLLQARSRPGVFSHRRIDPGARQLINQMWISDNARVIDVGCGSGTVSIASCAAAQNVYVHGIDSHCRAVQCTLAGAGLNGMESISATVTDSGAVDKPGTYDVALLNPPYYADFRIAKLFLDTAQLALRPGGRLYVVGKKRPWYEQEMPERFQEVEFQECKGYVVVSARKPDWEALA